MLLPWRGCSLTWLCSLVMFGIGIVDKLCVRNLLMTKLLGIPSGFPFAAAFLLSGRDSEAENLS